MIEVVLGIDPGANTGWALAALASKLACGGGKVDLGGQTPVVQAHRLTVWAQELRLELSTRSLKIVAVAIEDVTEGAVYNRKRNVLGDVEYGHFRNPDSTAKLNRCFGLALGVVMMAWPVPVYALPISEWYLKIGGSTAKKAEAISYYRSQAGPDAKVLRTEHATMAYGLARYGADKLKMDRKLAPRPR